MSLRPFTVIGYGAPCRQLACWPVQAATPAAAFAAARRLAGADDGRFVAAVPGWAQPGVDLVWPGERPVAVDAILAQPAQFGAPLYAALQREPPALVITAAGVAPAATYRVGRWPLAAAAFLEGVLEDAPDMATLQQRLAGWPAWAALAAPGAT